MAHASAEERLALAAGSALHGFIVERVEDLPEIEGTAYLMRHAVSGTPLMWLANDDENRAFSIAFKTPPVDSTGVFHILEHAVLCGSDRYPVKEPFVNLLKTSMQTFLNAFTFDDKTMYPVASTNERDLLNLMDVYLDAVFHPALYRKRTIFEQEGWHYAFDDDGALRYNGVVLNEMKGALSDPEEVVAGALSAALFPDTAYGFVSGGDPRAIPQLTYESCLDTHARHYNPSNARVVLYGDICLDDELALLDEGYFAHAPAPAGAPNPLQMQAPVENLDVRVPMATSPENAIVAAGYVFGTAADRERCLAVDILTDALMGSNEAPLKRTLLDANLGCDVDAFPCDGTLQPFVMFELRGAEPDAKAAFMELLEGELAHYATDGVPRENLRAALESAAFSLRERDFGYADGVALAVNALSGWLHDDDAATSYLRYEDALASMRAGLETDYWERLVREVFVESRHRAVVELVPVEADDADGAAAREEAELAAKAAALTDADRTAIARDMAELRRAQDEPDAPEALAALPRLRVGDIGAARPEPAFGPVEDAPLACLYHQVPTRRIDYVYHYFDLSCLTWDEVPLATLASSLLGKMATEHHSAAQLDTLVEERLGRLTFSCTVHEDAVTRVATPRLVVAASAIAENVADLAAIPTEVWSSTDFSDTERIRQVLAQQRLDTEQAFATSGNSFAAARAWGYTSKNHHLMQHFGNVDYYRFVRDLLADWESARRWLPERLSELCRRVFRAPGSLHSFTGDRADLERYWRLGSTLGLGDPASAPAPARLEVPEPALLREAFVVPTDVCFVAKADDVAHTQAVYSGLWPVATRAVNYDYLWNEVRVKGGAYGCGLRAGANGSLGFYTYRDPNLDASLERMDRAAAWLASFDPTPDDLEGFIVSTVASHDAPQRAHQVALRQDVAWLTHREPGWRDRIRSEELAATAAAIRPLADALERLAARDAVCVFGSRSIIERSEAGLTMVDLLGDESGRA